MRKIFIVKESETPDWSFHTSVILQEIHSG